MLRLIRSLLGPILQPTLLPDAVPAFTTRRWTDEISAAISDLPLGHQGWFCQRWNTMDEGEQLAWVERRKAALIIIWVRGGSDGFQGLRERLCEALADIDG
jgi:hypothetical protein